MPAIIGALTESDTPFSILTKGTLLRRDLPMLRQAAERVSVGIGVSLAIHDPELQKAVEPGTPSPRARLDLIRSVTDAGLPCNVMVAPVIPYLTDSTAHLDGLLCAIAEAGATGVTIFPMHLRGSTRGWFLNWLASEHPALVRRYRQLYGRGAYVAPEYKTWLRARVEPMVEKYGLVDDPSTATHPLRSGVSSPRPARGPRSPCSEGARAQRGQPRRSTIRTFAVSAALAHRLQTESSTRAFEFVQQGGEQLRARRTQRMSRARCPLR